MKTRPRNFEQARKYAADRLERELSPRLHYHRMSHTTEEVVPAVERLAQMEGVKGEALELLLTAAWFHDLGYTEQPLYHELISARIASQELPGFGYKIDQIEIIRWAILATALPQSPTTLMERILVDADLDVLGRETFSIRSEDLRRELAEFGRDYTNAEWHASQLKFLMSHNYFTESAHLLRDAGKQKNITELQRVLEEIDLQK
jgi:uncharacterized protein